MPTPARCGRSTGRGQRLAFIAQDDLPPGAAYEAHIASTGCVPTRHNLHDFFNGSMWFAFPRIKAALNARQSAAIDVLGVGPTRGGVRDTLTLFDENALLFACADPALSAALRGFDWQTLLVARRDAWGARCEVRCFGHALLEKLIAPFKACTGHAWIVDVPSDVLRMGRCGARCMARRIRQHGAIEHRCTDEPHVCAAARTGHSRLVAGERIARVLRRHVRVSHRTARALTRAERAQVPGRSAISPLTGCPPAVLKSAPAKQARQSRPLRLRPKRARKVRTPQGRVMANGHPWRHAEQGNRKQTADGPAQAGIR